MDIPSKWIATVCLLVMLAGCAGAKGGIATGAMPPVQERTYRIEGQSQELSYVPVLRYEHAEWKSRMEDTLAPASTLEACKQALAEQTAKPRTGQFKGYDVAERVCFEVRKSGGQRKIVVSTASAPRTTASAPAGCGRRA